jgi:hypothetical protein
MNPSASCSSTENSAENPPSFSSYSLTTPFQKGAMWRTEGKVQVGWGVSEVQKAFVTTPATVYESLRDHQTAVKGSNPW